MHIDVNQFAINNNRTVWWYSRRRITHYWAFSQPFVKSLQIIIIIIIIISVSPLLYRRPLSCPDELSGCQSSLASRQTPPTQEARHVVALAPQPYEYLYMQIGTVPPNSPRKYNNNYWYKLLLQKDAQTA